mgnify:CR=1 FL=1
MTQNSEDQRPVCVMSRDGLAVAVVPRETLRGVPPEWRKLILKAIREQMEDENGKE